VILRTLTQNSGFLIGLYPITAAVMILCGWGEISCNWNLVNPNHAWGESWLFLFWALVVFNSMMINTVYNDNELFAQPSYLMGWIYSFFASIALVHFPQLEFWLGQSACILAFVFAFKVFRQKRAHHLILLSGLAAGLAFLLDTHTFIYPIVFLVAFNLSRPFSLRELGLLSVGFVLPGAYYWAFLFQYNLLDGWNFSLQSTLTSGESLLHQWQFWIWILAVLLGLWGLMQKDDRQTNKTQHSKNFILLLVLLSSLYFIVISIFFHPNFILLPFLPWILLVGHYWTHYRTSLLAPFIFYILLIFSISSYFHWI
jgi:hypothetical protein